MPNRQLLLRAEHLRARAEEMRTRAETFRNAESRQILRNIASDFVELAERLEQHAGTDDADPV
jgi:hypothetical protein